MDDKFTSTLIQSLSTLQDEVPLTGLQPKFAGSGHQQDDLWIEAQLKMAEKRADPDKLHEEGPTHHNKGLRISTAIAPGCCYYSRLRTSTSV